MKKKLILLIFICIFSYTILPIPTYIELNHLHIIKTITVECNEEYKITLKEIIPKKGENGIHYECKTSQRKMKILTKERNFFYNDIKYLYTNCSNKKEIIKIFNIHPKQIKKIPNKKANCNN